MAVNAIYAASAGQDAAYILSQLKQEKIDLENQISQTKSLDSSGNKASVLELEQEKTKLEEQISAVQSASATSSSRAEKETTTKVEDKTQEKNMGPAYKASISSSGLEASNQQQQQAAQQKKMDLISSLTL